MTKHQEQKLLKFFSSFKKLCFKRGEVIIRAGDSPPGVFYLKKGYVRMYSVSEEGLEATLNIFKPGSFFSLIWAIGNIPNTFFFEAITPAETYLAPKSELVNFLKKSPAILLDVVRRLVIGLYGISTRLESLVFGDAYSKVASTLVVSARRFGRKRSNEQISIELPLTHSDIAILSGTTRETASRQLKKLERKGLIVKRGQLYLLRSLEKLESETISH